MMVVGWWYQDGREKNRDDSENFNLWWSGRIHFLITLRRNIVKIYCKDIRIKDWDGSDEDFSWMINHWPFITERRLPYLHTRAIVDNDIYPLKCEEPDMEYDLCDPGTYNTYWWAPTVSTQFLPFGFFLLIPFFWWSFLLPALEISCCLFLHIAPHLFRPPFPLYPRLSSVRSLPRLILNIFLSFAVRWAASRATGDFMMTCTGRW